MKKIVCIISICLIFVSLFTFPAMADNVNTPSISITSTNAIPGDTIEVTVFLKNNPGIVSAKLNFNFDEKLTLIGATNGDVFSTLTYIPPKQLLDGASINSSCQFAWQGFDIEDEDIIDGKIITLVFAVSDNARLDESLDISVSTTQGNVVDKDLNPIMLSAQKSIRILDFLPGDVNEDGNINMLDTVSISRYIVDNRVTDPNGYNITLNERAANVNDDGAINMLDVVLLCRYIVDGCQTVPEPNGYNVELIPQTEKCLHNLTKTNAIPATCTANGNIAYWSCSKCHTHYKNATATIEVTIAETIINAHGHTEVIDAAVAPTYSSTGLTEGKHCSTCNTVLVAQQTVAALVPVYHSVSYENIKTADISSYPTRFAEHAGLDLNSLVPTTQGYTFEGWYVGANKLTRIPAGTTSNIVLTARWTTNNYEISLEDINENKKEITVTFNKNYSGSAPTIVTLEDGDVLPYPTNPTRSGYMFTGWYTTSACTTKYNFSGNITDDMTLYAGWTTSAYTISNNSSYPWSVSGSSLTSTNKSHSSSSEYRITASTPIVVSFSYKTSSESGYDYLYIKKNGTTLTSCAGETSYATYSVTLNTGDYLSFIYSKDGSVSNNSDTAYISNLTYAPNISYTSTATAICTGTDGFIYAEGSSYISDCDYGDSFTLPVPTRTGYTFDGWYDGVGGTGTKYTNAEGESVRTWDKAQKTTLYAKWVIKTFNLTLNNQGGTGAANVTVTYGEAMPRLTAPTKTGYTFAGYYNAATGGTKYYNADMTSAKNWDVDETATLYARWTATTYTITLNNQGGTGSSSATATYGSALPSLTAPTKTGYRFLGYYDAVTGGTQYYSSSMASQVTWNRTQAITLYARWEAIECTISFHTNQGSGAQSSVTATYGANMPRITVAPERTGYTFTGYYDATSGGTKYYNADLSGAKTWDKTSNTTLYAQWQVNSYTVRYNANGGTGTMADQQFVYGTSGTLRTNTFTRTGYTFAGWNTATNGTGTNYSNSASVNNLTAVANGTVVLYAKWTPVTVTVTLSETDYNGPYDVSFNLNGASGTAPATQTVTSSRGLTYPEIPTRSGYVFGGWYTTSSCTGTPYDFSQGVSSDITLYAKWVSTSNRAVTLNVDNTINLTTSAVYYSFIPLTSGNVTISVGKNGYINFASSTRTGYGSITVSCTAGTLYSFYVESEYQQSGSSYTGSTYLRVSNTLPTSGGKVSSGPCNVSFNLNGASGTAPATQTVTASRGLTYPTVPTRDGYVFGGWYTTSSCTGTPYDFSEDVSSDITLYAKWISYSGSGYVNYNSSKYVYAYSKDSSSSYYYAFVPLVSGSVTIYTNDTWDTYGYLYNSSKSLLTSNDDAGTNNNFSITYNVTAGTLYYIKVCGYSSSAYTTVYVSGPSIPVGGKSTVTTETDTLTYGESFTLTVPEKDHYTFAGWYDGVGGTGTKYTDSQGESVRVWDKTADTTLYAKWVAGTHTITFNNQGGTGASSVTAIYDDPMPRATAPTKTGYTFAGYYDAITGGTKYYNADMTSAKNWDVDGNATLYARWTANTYTITLNNQGGTGSSSATATYGSALPTLTAPTKAGHRFLGYYTATTGGTQYYSSSMASQVTWNRTTGITLYARWEAISYTVTFNTNQGSGAQTAVTATYGANMPRITVAPTKTGYTFAGYYDAVTGGTKYYNADLSSARTWDKESNTVLYAHWQGYAYTVRFNANGGTGTMANQTFEYGTSENLNSNTFTRTGYSFAGWNTAANGTGTNYANGASVLNLSSVANGTVTLYAKWTVNNYRITLDDIDEVKKDITVTFNKNYSGSTSSTVTLEDGDVLSYPTKPTRSGYLFTGWYTTSACTTKYNFSGNITDDMTLYAGWTTSGRTITNSSTYPWSVSGSSLTSTNKSHSSSSEYRITASIPLVVSFSYKTSSESGYDKLYIKKNGSTLTSCSGATSYVSYSVTLNTGDYLSFVYSKDGSVSNNSDAAYISGLTFASNVNYTSTATAVCNDVDGYIYSDGSTQSINCNYGDSFTVPVPTRTGYVFAGWYDGVGGTGTRYTNTEGESVKTWDKAQNTTLYAKWNPNTYNITYVLNGGTNHADNPATYTTASNITLKKPSKAGYSFIGWTTPTNSTPNMNYTINPGSMGNITLTANWIEYDVLDIEYDESINYIGINTTPSADYFGATCVDTDNNEVDITVTSSATLIAGQTVDITLTARSNGKTSSTTIEDVKVYGTPTITVGNTIINSSDSITASTFEATARDSFGVALSVSVNLVSGSATGSGNKTYSFSATDRCGNTATTNRSVMVYSANDITFDITTVSAIKETSTGEEFAASATDTFGNPCDIELVVQNGYTLAAGNTISLYFKATDENGNQKSSSVISGVKVYGEPDVICRMPKITTETDMNDIFRVVDSFGVELETTIRFTSTPVAGSDIGVRIIAEDAAGNTINEVRTVHVICINHAISANCTCEICDEIVHTPGEECVCLICDAVCHDLNSECYCENCGNYYHNFVSGECTVCETPDGDIWDGTVATSFARGSGTSSNPYVIETSSQLAYLAQRVNNGTSYSGSYFELANDLDLNNIEWTPIGKGALGVDEIYTNLAFSGNFNGNGHRINNCKINTTAHKRAGLFGGLNGATVRNLSIRNADIQVTQQHVVCGGVLSGTINNTTISNCDVSGTVYVVDTSTGSTLCANAGMITGRSAGTSSIQNCSASGDVIGRMTNSWNAYVGGLVGSDSSSSTRLTITNCYFTGNVTANGYESGYASGLVGISNTGTNISKCFAVANITSNTYSNAIAYPWSSSSHSISSTYYNSNKSSSYGTSTSVNNFKSQTWLSTNLGWDFTTTWEVPTGEYPKLKVFNN